MGRLDHDSSERRAKDAKGWGACIRFGLHVPLGAGQRAAERLDHDKREMERKTRKVGAHACAVGCMILGHISAWGRACSRGCLYCSPFMCNTCVGSHARKCNMRRQSKPFVSFVPFRVYRVPHLHHPNRRSRCPPLNRPMVIRSKHFHIR